MRTFPPELLDLLRSAECIAVLTGAGVSAESGIPTFRDSMEGYWARFNPHDLATPDAFGRNPELVSRWYDERRCGVGRCAPNAGHQALVALERQVLGRGGQFSLITQNVDGLHQTAGSRNVIELHGTLWTWRCIECDAETDERGPAFASYPCRCDCGGFKRPGVVWFGEPLPPAAMSAAQRVASGCDLLMSLGTSSVVYPAAGLIDLTLSRGGKVLEINPQRTPYSDRVSWWIGATTAAVLPEMMMAIARGTKAQG